MGAVTIELGVRKFRVPEAKASSIQRIMESYEASGMGRLLIARHLVGFACEDLVAFEKWRQCRTTALTDRFASAEHYENWHEKFKLIAAEITAENNLSEVAGCSC